MGRKLKQGDLVVLKKPLHYRPWPDLFADSALQAAIKEKSIVNYVTAPRRKQFDSIPVGTVGIVQGYKNVYMLSQSSMGKFYDHLSARPVTGDQLVKSSTYSDYYYYNDKKIQHLIVLIDGKVIGFCESDGPNRFFESSVAAEARADASIRFEITVNVKNASDRDIESSINRKLKRLSKIADQTELKSIIKLNRDGTVTKKVGDVIEVIAGTSAADVAGAV